MRSSILLITLYLVSSFNLHDAVINIAGGGLKDVDVLAPDGLLDVDYSFPNQRLLKKIELIWI